MAAGYLSTAARMEIPCTPVIAVWSSIGLDSWPAGIVDGADTADWIRSRPARYPEAWVDVVYATARRSDAWTAHH